MTIPAAMPLVTGMRWAPLLSMEGVRKTFARGLARSACRTVALRNVDLELHAGEVLGVLGGEGAGKTALLQCAAGLLRHDAGDIRWSGRLYEGLGWVPGVACIPAVPVYYPFLTVRDVLEVCAARTLPAADACPAAVEESLAALRLDYQAGRRVEELSRDEIRRLAVAEALASRPRAILLDTSCSSPRVSIEACFAIGDYSARGGCVMIATRDLSSVAAVVSRCVTMADGRVSAAGEVSISGVESQRLRPARFVAETIH